MAWDLNSEARLAALREVDTFPGIADEEFDIYTRLVTRMLGVPCAMVSFVTDDRQYFPSALGLREPLATKRQNSLDYSFCKHVVINDDVLEVGDARRDDRVKASPTVTELGVQAYLGVPLHAPGGEPLGALCALSEEPRVWSAADIEVLRDIAEAASATISLRVTEHRRTRVANEASHNLRTPLAALRLELEDLATITDADADANAGVGAATGHVDALSGIVDDLLATTQYAAMRASTHDLLVVAQEVAARRLAVGEAAPGAITVDGSAVKVNAPLPALRYALDVLMQCASPTSNEAVAVRVTANGVARLRIHSVSAGEVAGKPLPEPLVRQLHARLLVRPADDIAYELVMPVAP